MKPSRSLRFALALISAASCAFCSNAYAGRNLLADGTFDDAASSNYASDGQFWHSPQSTSATGTLQIPLNFGAGVVTGRPFTFDISGGRVDFANGDFIAPLAVTGGYNPLYQNGYWNYGELAPAYLTSDFPVGPFVYDTNTTLKAYRFTWQLLCPVNAGVCTFNDLLTLQAVLIAVNDDDYVLQFNYQNFVDAPLGSIGSFQLGAATDSYTGPFLNAGPNFCFHDGIEVACATAVPEPSPLLLLVAGLLILFVRRSRPRLLLRPL